MIKVNFTNHTKDMLNERKFTGEEIISEMRIKVDLESDALYFRINEDAIEESEEINKGLIVDYDANGKVVGIEILNIKNKFKLEDLTGLKLEMPTVVKAEA